MRLLRSGLLLFLLAPAAWGAESVSDWIARLGAEGFQVREEAQAKLVGMGEAALPALEAARDHSDPEVRARVSATIQQIQDGARLARLGSPDPNIREAALNALLKEMGEPGACQWLEAHLSPVLTQVLTDILFLRTENALRKEAVDMLAKLGPPHSLRGLLWAMDEQLGHLAAPAAAYLADQADVSVISDLELLVKRGNKEAAAVLVKTRLREAGKAVPKAYLIDREAIVREVRKGASPAVKVHAIRSIITGLAHWEEARTAVSEALAKDTDPVVRRGAAEAFRYLSPQGLEGPLLRAVREDTDREVRLHACLALSRVSLEIAGETLLSLAGKGDAEMRRAAASALGDIGDQGTLGKLEGLLKDESDKAMQGQLQASILRIRERLEAAKAAAGK